MFFVLSLDIWKWYQPVSNTITEVWKISAQLPAFKHMKILNDFTIEVKK